ncbi:MAG: hypothetical protein J6S67_07135 [Methanobrevibacter sp.]|nr:hypothetical protein [Methanobrevibacter sp.]
MNIDKELVARAFVKAGEEPITDDEWTEGTSSRVRVVKEFYLATILDALSSYNWTSQKKRARLTALDNYEYEEVLNPTASDVSKYWYYDETNECWVKETQFDNTKDYYLKIKVNLTGFMFMFLLPADCGKVVAINDGDPYIVEGGYIFCDIESPVLLYIRNYFTGKYVYEQVAQPVEADIDKYYTKDSEGNYEKATAWDATETYYIRVEEDYNFYSQPAFDPELSSYIECKLAASIALKLTAGTDKYQMLYNEARLIADGAMKRSAEQARNRAKGNRWWTDQLGLTSGGEI